jgi:hypothetical protein
MSDMKRTKVPRLVNTLHASEMEDVEEVGAGEATGHVRRRLRQCGHAQHALRPTASREISA